VITPVLVIRRRYLRISQLKDYVRKILGEPRSHESTYVLDQDGFGTNNPERTGDLGEHIPLVAVGAVPTTK